MALHDFTTLFGYYPEMIEAMPQTFNSHDFIVKLAQRYQVAYVEALYSYRNVTHGGTPAPFINAHRELAKGLRNYPTLVAYVDGADDSVDIFRQRNTSSRWQKV